MGSLFAHGSDINWKELYANRLVRDFVSPADRNFIENPCERPLKQTTEKQQEEGFTENTFQQNISSLDHEQANGLFSNQQIDFIKKLIQSEKQENYSFKKDTSSQQTLPSALPDSFTGEIEKEAEKTIQISSKDPKILLKLAAEITGFPTENLSLDLRLLDDLNLDSIKAGQFVAKALKIFGMAGQLDPTTMANSSLGEIYNSLTENPPASTPRLAALPKIPEPKQVETLPNPEDTWVRNFHVHYAKKELEKLTPYEEILAQWQRENKKVVIVSESKLDRPSLDISMILSQNNIDVEITDYASAAEDASYQGKNISCFIFLLPAKSETEFFSHQAVTSMLKRLYCVAGVIHSSKSNQHKPEHVVIQFGDSRLFDLAAHGPIESKGSVAFLSSVHLENPHEKIRVFEFQQRCEAALLVKATIEELATEANFTIAGYDADFRRHVPCMQLAETKSYKDRKVQWSKNDVILVTGGAKGITAECALAFAKKTGAKLAIIGLTVFTEKDNEIQKFFQRYRNNNITYRYYPCDVSNLQNVVDVRKRAEQDLGAITGVIHGAALNQPRRIEQVTFDEALKEIDPKLGGMLNICKTFLDSPPKMIIGFSSIIGVTGMMGNALYGFSNEALNLCLQQFKAHSKKTEIVSLAFSIWGGNVGMGTRKGRLNTLFKMGIHPIPMDKGVARFLQLAEKDTGEQQVIVSSRLAGIDTYHSKEDTLKEQSNYRFLEDTLFFEKNVEIEVKAVLTLEKDPYLLDHNFKGTYLLPTVFGLEAMAQAVFQVTNMHDLQAIVLEDIRLTYPITVSPDDSTEIRIRALVEERPEDKESFKVKAHITVDQTGFKKKHFAATFVLNTSPVISEYTEKIPKTPLDIVPAEDLYGGILFQGPMFQRIKSIQSIEESTCIFSSQKDEKKALKQDTSEKYSLGDPFLRDTLLQSTQLLTPELVALPIEIKKWEIHLGLHSNETSQNAQVLLNEKGSDIVDVDVLAISNSRIIEKLSGYTAKVLELNETGPRVKDFRSPDDWDAKRLCEKLEHYSEKIACPLPTLSLLHKSGFHSLKKSERHKFELRLFASAYKKLTKTYQEK